MENKYRSLRITQTILKIAAVTIGVLGTLIGIVIALLPTIDSMDYVNGQLELIYGPPLIWPGVLVIVVSLLLAVGLFAFAALIQLLRDMAADMRITAAYFEARPKPATPNGNQRAPAVRSILRSKIQD